MKYLKPIIITALQILTLIALYTATLFLLSHCFHYANSFNIAWGISIRFGIIVFALSALIINYIWILKLNSKIKYCILLLEILCFVSLYIKDLSYTPYKTGMFLLLVILSFLSFFIYRRLLSYKTSRHLWISNNEVFKTIPQFAAHQIG